MAINVNNFIVISETQATEVQSLPLEDRGSLRNFRSDIRRNVTPPDVTDADKPHVVVGGKAKKIGKTSAYMLDMLSLDD
jgi:hypothetical protein